MTNEQTKERFINILNTNAYIGLCECSDMLTAISALEKQIPKKPIIRKDGYESISYDCPCCGRYLVSEIDGELCAGQKYDYCFKCGTKIDWSDSK